MIRGIPFRWIAVAALFLGLGVAVEGPSALAAGLPDLDLPKVKVPNPFRAIGTGLEKLGDGLSHLNPFDKKSKQKSQYYPPGTVRYGRESQSKAQDKGSFWTRMIPHKKEKREIKSVEEWMKLPAVRH